MKPAMPPSSKVSQLNKRHSPSPFSTTFNHFLNACKLHHQLFNPVHDSFFETFCLNLDFLDYISDLD
jgi:hypothetical protein